MSDRASKSILLVSSDPRVIDLTVPALPEFEVLRCASGAEALQACERRAFDLAIVDAGLSGMTGHALCSHLRQVHPAGPKVILLAEGASPEERLAAYEAGADDCVAKPFAPRELAAKCRVLGHLLAEEQLGQLKSQLLDMVAHELRTPLTGIVVAAEILAKDEANRHAAEWIDMILDCARRLELLADKGLLLCQLRSDYLTADAANHDLAKIVRQVAWERSAAAEAEGVRIEVAGEERADAHVDRRHVEVLVRFLLDNALRYCRRDSTILLSVDSSEREVRLALTASARQILPINAFRDIVPRFSDNEFVGADLGLGLARELMQAAEGSVELSSSRDDQVSLTCWFPRARAERREAARRAWEQPLRLEFPQPVAAQGVDVSDAGCLVALGAPVPVAVELAGRTIQGHVVRTQMQNGRIGLGIEFAARADLRALLAGGRQPAAVPDEAAPSHRG